MKQGGQVLEIMISWRWGRWVEATMPRHQAAPQAEATQQGGYSLHVAGSPRWILIWLTQALMGLARPSPLTLLLGLQLH